jgi:hypothetical protein
MAGVPASISEAGQVAETFFEQPILNSPYEIPTCHHDLDADGQPTNRPPLQGRRRSALITPVPKPRKRKQRSAKQAEMVFADAEGLSGAEQEYNPTPIINEILDYVDAWRRLPNPDTWQVTPATARLLQHWRHHRFESVRPFFCQVEAVETIIWLTEVAPKLGKRAEKACLRHPHFHRNFQGFMYAPEQASRLVHPRLDQRLRERPHVTVGHDNRAAAVRAEHTRGVVMRKHTYRLDQSSEEGHSAEHPSSVEHGGRTWALEPWEAWP